MAEEKIDNTLGEVKNIMENKREDWVCHSQAIAAAMSNRMELLGMTQKALAKPFSAAWYAGSVMGHTYPCPPCMGVTFTCTVSGAIAMM